MALGYRHCSGITITYGIETHWSDGGNKAEIYYPPYYDDLTRPVINAFSSPSVPRGAVFDVEFVIDEERTVDFIALISLSAVTHSVNMTQRYLILYYEPDGTSLAHVLAPPVAYAPPGPYMLVVIDSNGIPSVAKVIYLE